MTASPFTAPTSPWSSASSTCPAPRIWNNALDSAERGYRIQISQPNNPPAQRTAQELFASGRAELAPQCNGMDTFNNNDIRNGGNNQGNPEERQEAIKQEGIKRVLPALVRVRPSKEA